MRCIDSLTPQPLAHRSPHRHKRIKNDCSTCSGPGTRRKDRRSSCPPVERPETVRHPRKYYQSSEALLHRGRYGFDYAEAKFGGKRSLPQIQMRRVDEEARLEGMFRDRAEREVAKRQLLDSGGFDLGAVSVVGRAAFAPLR